MVTGRQFLSDRPDLTKTLASKLGATVRKQISRHTPSGKDLVFENIIKPGSFAVVQRKQFNPLCLVVNNYKEEEMTSLAMREWTHDIHTQHLPCHLHFLFLFIYLDDILIFFSGSSDSATKSQSPPMTTF